MNRGRIEGGAREALRGRLRGLGFDEVRFAAVTGPAGASLRDWLGAGHQADMHWLERSAEKRLDARQVVPEARTVILLGVTYFGAPGAGDAAKPRWARYALHEDYHDTIKPGLVAAGRVLEETCDAAPADYRYYTDTGPVLERG